MEAVVASSPGKVILFGDHGIHRQVPNITTAVDMRSYCRVALRHDNSITFRFGSHFETTKVERLGSFKAHVDNLRKSKNLDAIVDLVSHDFFAPSRYVMSYAASRSIFSGLDVVWYSELPIGSGLGSGAAANTAMIRAVYAAQGQNIEPEDLIFLAWQGDAIAHGGYGSSLDSSTCVLGGLISYTLEEGARALPFNTECAFVIGDTLVEHRTNLVNTRVRKWLEENPARKSIFGDMRFLLDPFLRAWEVSDLSAAGHILNLHQLIQVKIGVSILQSDQIIEAAITAGSLGAKISGSGGGGIIIALAHQDKLADVAAAINGAGGRSFIVQTGAPGTRLEGLDTWESISHRLDLEQTIQRK